MEEQFWQSKWQKNEIGFHQAIINPYLEKFWEKLTLAKNTPVFVPMCGKSDDMLWLREQGHQVIGVELCKMAVDAFFAENNLPVTQTEIDGLQCYQTQNITLYCGDFFKLTATHLQNVAAIYDRASLVALPPKMRTQYIDHLFKILPHLAKILLVTMEYDQSQMDGPPFSVTEEEVQQHYASRFSIQHLESEDILDANPVFIERGLSRLQEKSFLLTPS